jgi:hypothetical protein
MVVLGFWVVLGTIAMMMMNRGSSGSGRRGDEGSKGGEGFSNMGRKHADADSDGSYAPG